MSTAQVFAQMFPGKPAWTVDQISDLTGKVTIVTGGNIGVGKETVKALLTRNAKVYMAARSRERAEAAIHNLENETGRRAIWLELDLSDLVKIHKAAQTFLSSEPELHILFNNAGVMSPPIEQVTNDGYDMQFGTNVIGHFVFTRLLTPALRAAAQTRKGARVVHTSSSVAYVGSLDFETFVDGPQRRKHRTQMLYCQSKLAVIMMMREFARRQAPDGIFHAGVNPGNLKTDLQRHMSCVRRSLTNLTLYPAPYGALTQLFVGTSAEHEVQSGKFYIPWAKAGVPPNAALDLQMSERLWEWLEERFRDLSEA